VLVSRSLALLLGVPGIAGSAARIETTSGKIALELRRGLAMLELEPHQAQLLHLRNRLWWVGRMDWVRRNRDWMRQCLA